jgi:hypothetical protein
VERLETRLPPANVDVLSYHNDGFLTGQNLQEEVLTPANVNATGFGKLFSMSVDGYVYATPLYKANLTLPGLGTHNVAFVATEHDSVYAFDTDNPAGGTGPEGSLWKTSFLDPANGITSVPAGDVGSVSTNIVPEVGITGTPVIDGTTGTLYVVAKTKEVRGDGAHYVQKLHALDIATGRERSGGPALIGDTTGTNNNSSPVSVPGNGAGAVGGVVTFNARKELQRPALQLAGGIVYLAWASHEDDGPYHGWVVGYNAANLAAGPVKVFNTAPNAGGVGIWQSGGALSADPQGNIYFAVGNGFDGPNPAFDPTHGNYSESVVKLSTTGPLTVAGSFTPFDWRTLDQQDADLGSGGAMLLPDYVGSTAHPRLMVETGKSGKIYLIDRDDLGGFTPGGPDRVVQIVTAGQAGVWGNPSFLKVNATTGIIYYHGQGDFLKGYYVSNGHIDDTPANILRSPIRSGYPGTQPVVSANGIANPTSPTNGIVWELQVDSYGTEGHANSAATLRAWRATDFSTELYDSDQTSRRDQPTTGVKFTVPTVVNGHVLVGTQYSFSVFGLFPAATSLPAPPMNLQAAVQATSQGPLVRLAWTNPNPAPGAAPTGIKVLRSTDGTTFVPVATVGGRDTIYTDAGPFTIGQRYFYQVVATNQLGDSAPSNTVDVIAPIRSAVLTITGVTSSSLGLAWSNVANDHYDIERSPDGINFSRVASVPASQTSYSDPGLAPGIYAYRIHALNVNPTADSLSNVQGGTVGAVIGHDAGFGVAVDLTANGDAQFAENAARLTRADLQTGSVFANTRLTIARFTTTFVARLHEGTQPDYADGFTFVIQANAPTALGQGLGGLGYQGIGNSVAVKFGTFAYAGDPSGSSTGLVLNGAPPRGGVTTGDVLLNSQNPKQITLAYDGTALTATIRDTLSGASFTTSFVVNIPQVIGSDLAYVGFTASTGSPGASSFWELQDITSWTFTSQAPLPGTPSDLRATAAGPSEIDLGWNGNSYNETGFRIERSTDGSTFTPAGTTTTTTFADRGLTHGTYYYRVLAFNANGASDFTNVVAATVPASDPPPVITGIAHSNFAVRPNGTITLTVNFTDPEPNDAHTAVVTWGDNSSPTTLPLAGSVSRFSVSHQYAAAPLGTNYPIQVAVRDDDGGSDTVTLTATAASAAPPAGLIDWYTGDGYGPTTAADIAGNNPGTLVGGVNYQPGKVGNAFSFNGTDGHVRLPNNFLPFPTSGTTHAPLSFTAWFKTTAGGVILGQQGGPAFGSPAGWVAAVYVGTDGKLWAQPFWTGGVQQASSATRVDDGQFHFVAMSTDGTTASVYLDNQLLGTIPGSQAAFTNNYFYQLGTGYTAGAWHSAPGGWYSYRGLIDEVQFFNSALTPAAVAAIYNAGSAGQVKGVTVLELPPALTSLTRSASAVNEGGTFTLNGQLSDPQPGDPLTAVVSWGDGAPDTTVNVPAGSVTYSASHRYADEPSSGPGYPLRVTLRDVAGGSDTIDLPAAALAVNPPANLVSWWTGDGTNATTSPDIAGTNPGTLNGGVTYAPGEVGNAFNFDGGGGSYVNIPDAPSLNVTTGATWDYWVKTAQSGSYVGFVGKHDAAVSFNGVTMYMDPGGLPSVQIKANGPTVTLTGSTHVNDGQFHHLALTFRSGGNATLYVDGQAQATTTAPVFTFNPNPLRFGRLLDPFWGPLRGLLDEVQVFNRELSAGEIQAIVHAGGAGLVKGVTVLDPAVVATGGFTINAVAGTPTGMQTVATFTDPAGPEPLGDYAATIDWGDNSRSSGMISGPDGTVFTVRGDHTYTRSGPYTLGVTIRHDRAADVTAASAAVVAPAAADHFVLSAQATTTAGAPFNLTVSAMDRFDNLATGYRGTVHFTSSDARAFVPADYTFTAADNGAQHFDAGFVTAGTQSLTATDTADPAVSGTQAFVVRPAAAASLVLDGFPSPVLSGTLGDFTVIAVDRFGNPGAVYTGTVHFTSSDPLALLPADYPFTPDDNGRHTFHAALLTAGTVSLTADDVVNGFSATQDGILVLPARLLVTGFPSPTTAGSAGTFTVTVVDGNGNIVPDYIGTVHFASSDDQAILPTDYTFTLADSGSHVFGAVLKTAGAQSISVTDASFAILTGTQTGIVVEPLPVAGSFTVADFPATIQAGTAGSFTVTVLDPYGNVATGYTGTVHFTSSDGQADLPDDYTFTAEDAGRHTFSATLKTAGTQALTVTDTGNGATGSQDGIQVTPSVAVGLLVFGYPSPTVVGALNLFTVTAVDAYGNTGAIYLGTVHFTSSDPLANLPGDYTFIADDHGTHTFAAAFNTVGTQSLTATDTADPSIRGMQDGIEVVEGPQAPEGRSAALLVASLSPGGHTTDPRPERSGASGTTRTEGATPGKEASRSRDILRWWLAADRGGAEGPILSMKRGPDEAESTAQYAVEWALAALDGDPRYAAAVYGLAQALIR